MRRSEPYNDEVRARFEKPVHAGDLSGDYAEVLVADVSESSRGARLQLAAGVADGNVAEFRFRAWGCPYLIAGAELYCSERERGPVAGLAEVNVNELMVRLSVPIEKTGRMLLIEDAARSLTRKAA